MKLGYMHLAMTLRCVKRPHRRVRGDKVAIETRLEFMQQHLALGVVPFVGGGNLGIDDDRAGCLHRSDRALECRINVRMVAHGLAQHTDARAFQRIRPQMRLIIERVLRGGLRCTVLFVGPDDRRKQGGGIGNTARHRARSVLAVRNRDDAAAAHQSHGWLDADEPGHRRRADDAAVGLRADASGGHARGDRRAGAGARTARVAIEHVWILRLATARAPARRRAGRSDVGPLAEVGLAENHGAGFAQLAHHERIGLRAMFRERE